MTWRESDFIGTPSVMEKSGLNRHVSLAGGYCASAETVRSFLMKKCQYLFLAVVAALLMCGSAMAADFETRGSAVVIGLEAAVITSTNYKKRPKIYVTNISGSDVTCKISLFDHDGNDATSYTVYTGSSTSYAGALVSSDNAPFTIPAGATREINAWPNVSNENIKGYALIEWSSEASHIRKALAINASLYSQGTSTGIVYQTSLTVIGNQPF